MSFFRAGLWILVLAYLVAWGAANISCSTPAPTTYDLKFIHRGESWQPIHQHALKLAEEVDRRTQGRVKIEVYALGGAVGKAGVDREVLDGLREGTIDMGDIMAPYLSQLDPRFEVFSLPFAIKDVNHLYRIGDSPFSSRVDGWMRELGLKLIGFGSLKHFYELSTSREVATPTDLQGMKIVVPGEDTSQAMVRALGAIPVPLPEDLPAAIRDGLVDGASLTARAVSNSGLALYAPHLALTRHQMVVQLLTMSLKTWHRLPPKFREVIMASARDTRDYYHRLADAWYTDTMNSLSQEGIILHQVDRERFRGKMAPVYQRVREHLGGEVVDAFLSVE